MIHTNIEASRSKRLRSRFVVLAMLASVGVAAQHVKSAGPAAPAGSAIVRNPSDLPAPVGNRPPEVVRVPLNAQEVVAALDPANGVYYRYWTFNGKVPGPMIRVRVGDTVELTLHNQAGNAMVHSIDLHAAFGPGGGSALMQVLPGTSKTFTFAATVPGLFVYHCGTPEVADHIANGMYGMILVEPPGGLRPVDHEYYVMQGEIYTAGPGSRGQILALDEARVMAESPQYFVFNGAAGSLTTQYPLTASVGQTVRIFFGNAGPNATSSAHMVGEIFARSYAYGSLSSPPLEGVQTATVPPGDAAIFELKAEMPGQFNFVDHAIARVQKGLVAYLDVTGADVAHLMYAGPVIGATSTGAGARAAATVALGVTSADADAAVHPLQGTVSFGATAADAPASVAAAQQARLVASAAPARAPEATQVVYERTLESYLGNLGANARYAEAMFRLYKASPAAVPAGWRDVFRTFTSPPADAPAEPVVLPAGVVIEGAAPRVTMTDAAFVPAAIEIQAGQAVTWVNTSATIHTVVDDVAKALNAGDVSLPVGATAFSSPFLLAGQSFTQVFNAPGIYHYTCTQHEHNGMAGMVIVVPAGQKMAADHPLPR